MAGSNVSSVVNYFATVNEGFITTLQSTIAPGAAIVALATAAGLTNGSVFVGMIEPGGTNQQVFTGTVDTVGVRITGVVWTRGSNVTHNNGVTIVDYTTGTAINMITTGILKFATQTGKLNPTDIYDVNGNKIVTFSPVASAVNRLQVDNAAANNAPALEAIGTDSIVPMNLKTKGSDTLGKGLQYNGTGFRALPKDWCRYILGWGTPIFEQPVGTNGQATGTGWVFPSNTAAWVETSNTQNAEVRYKVYLDAGTYTFLNYYRTGADKGIVTWGFIDESGVVTTVGGGTDLYAASGSSQVTVTSSGLNFTTGGYFKVWFKTATKNASSTGFILPYFGSQITRTA